MTTQHSNQSHPATTKPHEATPAEDLASKHLLDSPKGPTPAPNPESAPEGDKVGGEMTTAPFTGAPLHQDKGQPQVNR